jgi:hypothetical protein
VAGAASLDAQGSGSARFSQERNVDASAGPQRLDIDVALLAGSQPFSVRALGERWVAEGGLNDVRLFGGDGREIPYLLIPPAPDAPVFVAGRVLPITATDTPNDKASGFEVDFETIGAIDAIDLSRVRAPFLKRFRLEGSGDRSRWTQLIAEGTAFNLPAEQLSRTRIEFPAGEYRYVRVTWDDTNSGRVGPPDAVFARRVTVSSPGPLLRAPVAITARPSEPGRTRFRLSLPAARLPIVALELTVAGGHLSRKAWVLESRLIGEQAEPQLIGQAQLVRVMQEGVSADALRIPIRQPTEPDLDLVVDDGDNPPLALEGVTAVFAELPWLYFESAGGSITARYGDPRLAAPRYDLEAIRDNVPVQLTKAIWRTEPPRTLAPAPDGLPMPQTGSALTLEGFEYLRDVPAGPAGLIAIPLDAAVMARSGVAARRLSDVRVIDRNTQQIPYLLEKRDEPLLVDVSIERREVPPVIKQRAGHSTAYVVRVPYNRLPDARLALTTRARVFKRTVTLGTLVAATERQPARFASHADHLWVHADEATPAPSITFSMPEAIAGDLMLLVEEGDNQPLPIEKATVLLPSYAIRLFRPAGEPLRLVYGKDGVAPPRYDLQLLAPQVMGRRAEEITAGSEQRFGEAAPRLGIEMVPPAVFWSVLSLAVLVLLGMVAKLMRREAAQ